MTVLQREAVEALALKANSTVVDATFGAGGHAQAILARLGKQGTYIGIDVDPTAFTNTALKADATTHLVTDNFRNLENILRSFHISNVDAVLADLGWRMEQFSTGGKGFSFLADEPLAMTFGATDSYPFTAADIINEWDEATIADILFGYGEERAARMLARRIVEQRKIAPIQTARQLSALVERTLRVPRQQRIHPATKTFQALRIAVNDELGALEDFLTAALSALAPGGRLAIITFHSLEDRVVKHRFRDWVTAELGTLYTKKPINPSPEEVTRNPRARSAKLRVFIRT